MHDGIRQSKARSVFVAHNDTQAFDDAITRWRLRRQHPRAGHVDRRNDYLGLAGDPAIAQAMDGRSRRSSARAEHRAAARHEAMLLLDEAHATGVFGDRGWSGGASPRICQGGGKIRRPDALHMRQGGEGSVGASMGATGRLQLDAVARSSTRSSRQGARRVIVDRAFAAEPAAGGVAVGARWYGGG